MTSLTISWYEEFLNSSQSAVIGHSSIPRLVQKNWSPPYEDTIKLNVDGSFIISAKFRDHVGSFIVGFSYRKVGVASPLHIELLAIRDGLLFLQAMGIFHAVINSDCMSAVQTSISSTEDLSSLGNLIEDIRPSPIGCQKLKNNPIIAFFHLQLDVMPNQKNILDGLKGYLSCQTWPFWQPL